MTKELFDLDLFNDANLQAYYRLENTSDSKNSNTLTNNNSTPFNAAKFGNGADGGSSDNNRSLSIASALGYTAGGDYSISLWVKLNTEIASGIYDFCELAETTNDTSLLISYEYNSGTRRLNAGRLRAGIAFDSITHNVALGTSEFHHIALTKSGTTLRLYLDGVDVGNVTSSGNGSSNLTTVFRILEGRTANNNSTLGIIDDVALFNRNLTANEVALIYNGPSASGAFLAFI